MFTSTKHTLIFFSKSVIIFMILYIIFFCTNICMYFSCFQLSFGVDFARFNQLFCFLAHLLLFTLLPSSISHTHTQCKPKKITSLYLLSFRFVYWASTFIAHNSFSSQFCFIIILLFTSLHLNFHMPLFPVLFLFVIFSFFFHLWFELLCFLCIVVVTFRFTLRNFDRILIISLLLSVLRRPPLSHLFFLFPLQTKNVILFQISFYIKIIFYNFLFAHNSFSVLITVRREYSNIIAASVYLFWKYTNEFTFLKAHYLFSPILFVTISYEECPWAK